MTHKKSTKSAFPAFIAATVVVFFLSLSAAESIGFVPSYIDGSTSLTTGGSTSFTTGGSSGSESLATEEVSLADFPQLGAESSGGNKAVQAVKRVVHPARIVIKSVGIDLPVQNPTTIDVERLDALLVNGPARYGPSATLGAKGNIIIFAHSSNLPIVRNKMYQAFNRVPEVGEGATIVVEGSDGKEYVYSVNSVVRADVKAGTKIDLMPSDTPKLTLVTCDTLTGKSARYILTADFIGTN